VVWTQFYSKECIREKLEVQSDAAPTSDWPGLFRPLIGRRGDTVSVSLGEPLSPPRPAKVLAARRTPAIRCHAQLIDNCRNEGFAPPHRSVVLPYRGGEAESVPLRIVIADADRNAAMNGAGFDRPRFHECEKRRQLNVIRVVAD
jgi:hypothetical protein